jgi:maltooligosyltrehalose synthase
LASIPNSTGANSIFSAVGNRAWPLEHLFGNPSAASFTEFRDRINAFLVKALREAKRTTSWRAPDTGYEKEFIEKASELLTPESRFVRRFAPNGEPACHSWHSYQHR